jgi:DNA polymerase III delta prime subunit
MNELVINSKTLSQIKTAENYTSHAYIFVGKEGLGKTLSARLFAEKIIGSHSSVGDRQRWIMLVDPIDGKKISIEQMRKVRKYCNNSTPENIANKVVIIDRAENMGVDAYNCLLTLLEEPPPKTVIILVSHNKYSIPKTVLSRLQTINFYPPNMNQLSELINESGLSSELVEFSAKLPAKIVAFTNRKEEIERLIKNANDFLGGGTKDRLMLISTISDKIEAKEFMDFIGASLQSRVADKDWIRKSEGLILAQSHLYNNGNTKLVMENLALEF